MFLLEIACFKEERTVRQYFVLEIACFKDKLAFRMEGLLEMHYLRDRLAACITAASENAWQPLKVSGASST